MGYMISRDGLKSIKLLSRTCLGQQLSLKFLAFLVLSTIDLNSTQAFRCASTLRELTSNHFKFTWAKQHDEAFASQRLANQYPALESYNKGKEVTTQTDASGEGLVAVLLQNGQPLTFASRTLSSTKQRQAAVERECLEKVFADILEVSNISSLPSPKNAFQAATNLSVKFKPDSLILLADRVPGAAQDETPRPEESFEVFSLELESLDRTQALKDTPERFHYDLFFRNGQ